MHVSAPYEVEAHTRVVVGCGGPPPPNPAPRRIRFADVRGPIRLVGSTPQWNSRFRGRLIGQVTGKIFRESGARAMTPGTCACPWTTGRQSIRGRLIRIPVDVNRP